jgi:hypothetical protein
VNFALAVDRIDLSQHQPHPPGHFGYVFAGRALRLITPDEHAALVLATVIASGIAALLGFFLAFSSVSRCRWPTAAYTLLLILSSVTFAFYQRVAEIYMCDLLFTTAFAVAAVAAIDQRPRGALVVGVIWALAGWFKVSLLVLLLPAAMYTALRISMPRRWMMAAAFSATLLVWLPATVYTSGPRPYFSSAYEQLSQGTSAS